MFRSLILILILILLGVAAIPSLAQSQGQDLLTLENAIQIGLENNFSIRISQNEASIAVNNRSLGNAGFLPELSATASRTQRIENSRTEFSGDAIPDQDVTGARSANTSANVSMSWTIFDGLGMFTTYDKLGELQDLGEIEARLTVENSVAQIITGYYNIIRQQKIEEVLANTVELSEQRIQIAETKLDLGSGSEYELLQARADLNADRAAIIQQEVTINRAKILLNELLGREVDTEYSVQDEIPVNDQLIYDEIVSRAMAGNLQLSVARSNQRITELEIDEIEAERYPELDLNVGYGYNLNEPGSGILELSQSNGLNYGLTARISLFNGFDISRRKQNAQIRLKNQQLSLDEQQQQVRGSINAEFTNYLNALRLVELEEENLTYAQQTVEIALERFRLGTINSIELREAQRTLIDAESRLIQARYQAKAAETELYRLTGMVSEQPAE